MLRRQSPARPGAGTAAWWPWIDRGLGVALGVLVALHACFKLMDTDVWWHLKTGQLILQRHSIPYTDWFQTGFVDSGRPYIDLHWLFQVLIYGVYAAAGAEGLVAMKMLLAVVAVLLATRLTRQPAVPVAGFLCWVPVLYLMGGRFIVRPELATLGWVALFLVVLEHARRRPTRLWILPVAQGLWVNMHAMFIFGPLLVALWWADAGVRRLFGWAPPDALSPRQSSRFFKQMGAVSAAVLLVCLANPYFVSGVLFPLELAAKLTGGEDPYSARIAELQTPWSVGETNFFVQLQLGLAGAAGVSFLLNRRRFSPFRLLAAAFFTLLGFQATRNAGLYALVLGAVLAANVAEFAYDARQWRWVKRLPDWWPVALRSALVAAMLFSAFVLVTNRFYDWVRENRWFGFGITPLWYATDAVDFIARADLPQRAFVAHIGQSGVFLYKLSPPYRLAMDARLEVNSLKTFQTYFDILDRMAAWMRPREPGAPRGPAWEPLLQTQGIELALVDHQVLTCEAAFLDSPDWRCLYYDAVASVFVHQRHQELVRRYGLDFLQRHFQREPPLPLVPEPAPAPPAGLAGLLRSVRRPLPALKEARHLMNLDAQLLAAGSISHHRGLCLNAVRRARQALAQDPASAEAHWVLGRVYYHYRLQGEPVVVSQPWDLPRMLRAAQSAFEFRRALELDPDDFKSLYDLWILLSRCGALDLALEPYERLSRVTAGPGVEVKRRQLPLQARQELPRWQAEVQRRTAACGVDRPWNNRPELLARRDAALEAGLAGRALRLIDEAFPSEARMPWPIGDRQATVRLLVGQPAEARRLYRQRLLADAPPDALAERVALTWLVQGEYGQALEGFRHAVELNPYNLDAHWGLIAVYQEIGHARAAYTACQAALRALQGHAQAERLAAQAQAIRELRDELTPYAQ